MGGLGAAGAFKLPKVLRSPPRREQRRGAAPISSSTLVALVERLDPPAFPPSSSIIRGLSGVCQRKGLNASRNILGAHFDYRQPHWIDLNLLSSRVTGSLAKKAAF